MIGDAPNTFSIRESQALIGIYLNEMCAETCVVSGVLCGHHLAGSGQLLPLGSKMAQLPL